MGARGSGKPGPSSQGWGLAGACALPTVQRPWASTWKTACLVLKWTLGGSASKTPAHEDKEEDSQGEPHTEPGPRT